MDISTIHQDARYEACRIPALKASLALLVKDTTNGEIQLWSGTKPSPGGTPTGTLVVTIDMTDMAGTVNEPLYQLWLDVPLQAQILGADPANGTVVTWARIKDGSGNWWGDLTLSDEAGAGEVKLEDTLLYNGAFARITSGTVQG